MAERTTGTLGRVAFVADHSSMERTQGKQVDWTQVPDTYRRGAVIVQTNGAVLEDAVSITVDPLPAALKRGYQVKFGLTTVTLTADAAKSATTLAVEAVSDPIADNVPGYYAPDTAGKFIPAGKAMARLSSGKMIPRDGSNPATEILQTNAQDDSKTDATSGYGTFIGGSVFDRLLPDYDFVADAYPSTIKTELAVAGCTFKYQKYLDNRG